MCNVPRIVSGSIVIITILVLLKCSSRDLSKTFVSLSSGHVSNIMLFHFSIFI